MNRKGQNILEYIFLLVAIITVIVVAFHPKGTVTQNVDQSIEQTFKGIECFAETACFEDGGCAATPNNGCCELGEDKPPHGNAHDCPNCVGINPCGPGICGLQDDGCDRMIDCGAVSCCTPPTTADCLANSCEPLEDPCGGPDIQCNTCVAPEVCQPDGSCACIPKTVLDCLTNFCGSMHDGCTVGAGFPPPGMIDCSGNCPAHLQCVSGTCQCVFEGCLSGECGNKVNPCNGVTVSCGACPSPCWERTGLPIVQPDACTSTCPGNIGHNKACPGQLGQSCLRCPPPWSFVGESYQCRNNCAACSPLTINDCPNTICGAINNGCGGSINCPNRCTTVDPNFTCGGGGTLNVCGCTPKTVADCTVNDCGQIDDGCGDKIICPDLCNTIDQYFYCGGGGPNKCGCEAYQCQPGECGYKDDTCGGKVNCGLCTYCYVGSGLENYAPTYLSVPPCGIGAIIPPESEIKYENCCPDSGNCGNLNSQCPVAGVKCVICVPDDTPGFEGWYILTPLDCRLDCSDCLPNWKNKGQYYCY